MSFGSVFGEAWKEYKAHFKVMSQLQLVYYILPAVIVAAVIMTLFFAMGLYDGLRALHTSFLSTIQEALLSASTTPIDSQSLFKPLQEQFTALILQAVPFILISVVLGVISGLFSIFGYTAIASSAVKKKAFGFSEAVREAKKYYWKVVGLVAFLMVVAIAYFLVVLLIAALIPIVGILLLLAAIVVAFWVMVSWGFALYFIVAEGKGVFAALGASWDLVKGRWWKTFGYMLLFGLIVLGISIAFGIVQWVFQAVFLSASGLPLVLGADDILSLSFDELSRFFIITNLISGIVKTVSNFLLIPLMLLFMKNLYVVWKKGKK